MLTDINHENMMDLISDCVHSLGLNNTNHIKPQDQWDDHNPVQDTQLFYTNVSYQNMVYFMYNIIITKLILKI